MHDLHAEKYWRLNWQFSLVLVKIASVFLRRKFVFPVTTGAVSLQLSNRVLITT